MRNLTTPLTKAAASLTCALVLGSVLAGCSSGGGTKDPKPDVSPEPTASGSNTVGGVTRQLDPRDAKLKLVGAGPCRFDDENHGATQKLRLTGVAKNPVQAGLLLVVTDDAGTQAGTQMQTVRIEKPGKVDQTVTVTAQMSDRDWNNGSDNCVSQLTWTPLANQ